MIAGANLAEHRARSMGGARATRGRLPDARNGNGSASSADELKVDSDVALEESSSLAVVHGRRWARNSGDGSGANVAGIPADQVAKPT